MRERTIYITNNCPHKCSFCSTDAGPNGRVFDDICEALDWLLEEDAEFVHVSGGEPLRHPYFAELWKVLRERYGDNLCLWTNEIPQLGYNKHVRPYIELHPAVICTDDDTQLHVLKLVDQGCAARRPRVTLSGQWTGKCVECDHLVRNPDGTTGRAPCAKGKQT